ncbi:MAG: hypothetical protein K1X83_12450 [Oligoflexia bacterium]|nr:hypothetical protein [Oligoflexia bacterium]
MITIIAGLLLAAVVVTLVVKPLFDNSADFLPEDPETEQSDRRERLLQLIKDLELDFSTGKISESDYKLLKLRAAGEIAAGLKSAPK